MADEPTLVSVGQELGSRFQFGILKRSQPAMHKGGPNSLAQAGKAFDIPNWNSKSCRS
jgi:hypothetical protein